MAGPRPGAGEFVLLYFASASSFTRRQHDLFSAPLSISELYDALEQKYPGIRAQVLASAALTVNLDYVDVDESAQTRTIQAGDEVAIIPPVSSG